MNKSTKTKMISILNDSLREAKFRKFDSQRKLRSCEENIRWAKRAIPKNSKALAQIQKMTKDLDLNSNFVDDARAYIQRCAQQLKKDRQALKTIQANIRNAAQDVRKYNDLINEVNPYKK